MLGIAEKEIAQVWGRQLLAGGAVSTEEGDPLEVIEAGWPNDDRGPDFKDAVLRLGSELVKGDVEIHVKSSGWWEHGHHLDTVYNRVVLHVVMWHDAGTSAQLKSGGRAPTLVLRKYGSLLLSSWPGSVAVTSNDACRGLAPAGNNGAARALDEAGEERFLGKAACFAGEMGKLEAGQCLYRGVMGALGYSRNKLPFLELAHRVPLRLLEELTAGGTAGEEWLLRWVAVLLGASGLLAAPGQRQLLRHILGDGAAGRAQELMGVCPSIAGMSLQDWNVLKVRPNNSPVLRLVALSFLLLRYRQEGWWEGLVGLVKEAPPGRKGYRNLEAGLEVSYGNATLLGRGRAADIIVNVLLPFTYAWSRFVSEPGTGEKALGIFKTYPRLAENSVEKQMTDRLGLERGLVNSALRQQGLIHIYKNLCSQGNCDSCPLAG